MTQPTTDLAVRQSVTVDAPPEHAFAVFTCDLASWWPLHSHHIGSQPAVAVVVEPRAGGAGTSARPTAAPTGQAYHGIGVYEPRDGGGVGGGHAIEVSHHGHDRARVQRALEGVVERLALGEIELALQLDDGDHAELPDAAGEDLALG